MYYIPPWCLFGLNRAQTKENESSRYLGCPTLVYGCRLFFFINLNVLGFDLNVLGFDLNVLGLKKRVLGFEKRVLGFEKGVLGFEK